MSITRSITLDMLFSNCRWADLPPPRLRRFGEPRRDGPRQRSVQPALNRRVAARPDLGEGGKVGSYVSRERGHVRGIAFLGPHDKAVDGSARLEPELRGRDHGFQPGVRDQPLDVRTRVVVAAVRPQAV